MEKKTFYRVGSVKSKQGLWYDSDGNFTGLIHDKFDFCKNKDLPMPYDKEVVGFLSTVDKLEDLYFWFTKEDIAKLNEFDYYIFKYESTEYKYYDNHWLIHKDHSKIVEQL